MRVDGHQHYTSLSRTCKRPSQRNKGTCLVYMYFYENKYGQTLFLNMVVLKRAGGFNWYSHLCIVPLGPPRRPAFCSADSVMIPST